MNENEVIIVDSIPEDEYKAIVNRSLRYAAISLPFTVDRMGIAQLVRRSLNIAKGKIAEGLFNSFCIHNNIPVDFDTCTTPFWTIDHRDFLLNDCEWDVKNNFLYHSSDKLDHFNYVNLPALVPNRFGQDQWGQRLNNYHNSKGVKFLFTFLKAADLNAGVRGDGFLDINYTQEQIAFLTELCEHFDGQPQDRQPYTEKWFWDEFEKRGTLVYFILRFKPSLIITSYCDNTTWDLFQNSGRDTTGYHDYVEPEWYRVAGTGSLNFLNGSLWTTIRNATCPVSLLPSFLSLFPTLNNNLHCARIKE